jgi:hypothetical protein
MEAAAKVAQEEAGKKAAQRNKRGSQKPTPKAEVAPTASAPAAPAATMTLFGGSQPIAPTADATGTTGGGGESRCKLAL